MCALVTGVQTCALPIYAASGAVTDAYNTNQGRTQEISNGLFDAYKAFGADMGSDLDGTRSYMGDVLGGKYLDQQNPYLESMIDQTNDSVMDRVNELFSK